MDIEFSSINLYDNIWRLSHLLEGYDLKYTSTRKHTTTSKPIAYYKKEKIYNEYTFFFETRGLKTLRVTYSFVEFLTHVGGLAVALFFCLMVMIGCLPNRSFNFDLVTKHMKVKRRATKVMHMSTVLPLDNTRIKMIFDNAGIDKISYLRKTFLTFVMTPSCCNRRFKNTRLNRVLKRG